MKKFFIASASILFIALAAFLIVATIYFKPFLKGQIETQLANLGFEDAVIGDVSVGIYESRVSEIDLNNGSDTIGAVAVTYWPQQLLSKRIDAVKIEDGHLNVTIENSGDVIVAGYRIDNALQTKQNDALVKISDGKTASGTQSKDSAALPFNEIIVKNMKLNILSPSQKTINATIDATYNMTKKSVEGALKMTETDVRALQEIARVAKPEIANMVTNLSGTASADMTFAIANLDKMDVIKGGGIVKVTNVSLIKDGIDVKNLSTNLKIDQLLPLTIPTGQVVTIEQVRKSGIPIKNIKTAFGLKDMDFLTVDNASLDVAGGTIKTESFKTALTNIDTLITMTVESVDFSSLSDLLAVKALDIKGKLSGTIPLRIKNGKVIIDQAVLNSVIQSVAGQKLQEKANEFLSDKIKDNNLGNALGTLLGTPASTKTTDDGSSTNTEAQKPNVKNVIDGLLGGFGN